MTANPDSDEHRRLLRQRIRTLAFWLDEAFTIPGTSIRIGLDPLIGMVPVLGDLVGMVPSLWLILQARAIGAPPALQWQMVRNVLLETVLGLVPLVGDLFDFGWKANSRNVRLLDRWLEPASAAPPSAPRRRLGLWLAGLLFLAAAAGAIVIAMTRS